MFIIFDHWSMECWLFPLCLSSIIIFIFKNKFKNIVDHPSPMYRWEGCSLRTSTPRLFGWLNDGWFVQFSLPSSEFHSTEANRQALKRINRHRLEWRRGRNKENKNVKQSTSKKRKNKGKKYIYNLKGNGNDQNRIFWLVVDTVRHQ